MASQIALMKLMVTVFLEVICLKALFELEYRCYFLKVSWIEISRFRFQGFEQVCTICSLYEMGLNLGNINHQNFETITKTLLILVVLNLDIIN